VIISASRRTDLPAFYSRWLMNRIRAGYCLVPNPFNPLQVARVSLRPEDVSVLVFWTRNAQPLIDHLEELDRSGYRYQFLYTIMDNPRALDPHVPSLQAALRTFRSLAGRLGPDRVVWRYDPIVLSNATGIDFHLRTYGRIARALQGCTNRSIISLVHVYRKVRNRLAQLREIGVELEGIPADRLSRFMGTLAEIAGEHGLDLSCCAPERGFAAAGVTASKCIDAGRLSALFGITLDGQKDPAQRSNCGCAPSKDIGMYDSCPFGCRYCYATTSFDRAAQNFRGHDPLAPSLLPAPRRTPAVP
jgi:hypothetical protein